MALLALLGMLLAACDASGTPTAPAPAATRTLYIGADDGTLTALDATSGKIRWSAPLGSVPRTIVASAALMYAATTDGTLVALRTTDGATAWTARVGSASQVALAGGALVLLGADGDAAAVYALDATTGTMHWRHPAARDDTLAANSNLVYLAHNTQTPVDGPTDGFLSALRIADGSAAWRFETGGETLGAPTISDGTVYAPSSRGLFALDATTGAKQWYATVGTYNGVPALVGQSICVTTASAAVGLSPRDGHVLWRAETRNEIVHTSLIGGTLYLATYDRLLALDAATGAQRWAFAGAGPFMRLFVPQRSAYVADGAGTLHTLDTSTGRERWHTAGVTPVAATDMAVYAVRGGDTVVALRAGDGAGQWRYRAAGAIVLPVVAM